jgi:hypothetical protein
MANANTFPHVIQAKDIPDLASIHVAELDFGAICFVISVDADFTLTPHPSTPPDGVNVVSPVPQAAVGKPGAAWQKGGGGGGGTEFLEGTTLAALAFTTGSDGNSVVYVFDTHAFYRWNPGGSATPDGWTVVSAPGGQWLLQGATIALSPLGGGSDDWVRLFGSGGAAQAMSYKGEIVFLPGPWTCSSKQIVPSGTTILGSAGVKILSTLAPSGDGFSADPFYAVATTFGASNVLASNAVIGLATLSLATIAGISAGSMITASVSAANFAQSFIVQSISGTGPFTVNLDRPVLYPFESSSANNRLASVYAANFPRDIQISGGGMTISGTGDRAIEIAGGWDCLVEDVHVVSGGFVGFAMAFDVGSFRCGFRRCTVNGAQSVIVCMALEANEASFMEDCNVIYSGSISFETGFYCYSSRACTLSRCRASNCEVGAQLDWDGGTAAGFSPSENCRLIDSDFYRNSSHGVHVQSGSNWVIESVSCNNNFGSGIYVENDPTNNPPTVATGTKIIGCQTNGNAVDGVTIVGAVDTEITSLTANQNSGYGLNTTGNVIVTNIVSRECVTGGINVSVGGSLIMSEYDVSSDLNGFWIGITLNGTIADPQIADGVITMQGTGTKIGISHATGSSYDRISNSRTVGGTFGYVNNTAGSGMYRGALVDFSSATTPFSFSGAQPSWGTVVLNGATPVSFPFARANAGSIVNLTYMTAGGAPNHAPSFTIVPGTGISVTGTAGDTSTYAVNIN